MLTIERALSLPQTLYPRSHDASRGPAPRHCISGSCVAPRDLSTTTPRPAAVTCWGLPAAVGAATLLFGLGPDSRPLGFVLEYELRLAVVFKTQPTLRLFFEKRCVYASVAFFSQRHRVSLCSVPKRPGTRRFGSGCGERVLRGNRGGRWERTNKQQKQTNIPLRQTIERPPCPRNPPCSLREWGKYVAVTYPGKYFWISGKH